MHCNGTPCGVGVAGGGNASDSAQQQWLALPQSQAGQAGQHHLPADQAATAVHAQCAPFATLYCTLLLLLLPLSAAIPVAPSALDNCPLLFLVCFLRVSLVPIDAVFTFLCSNATFVLLYSMTYVQCIIAASCYRASLVSCTCQCFCLGTFSLSMSD